MAANPGLMDERLLHTLLRKGGEGMGVKTPFPSLIFSFIAASGQSQISVGLLCAEGVQHSRHAETRSAGLKGEQSQEPNQIRDLQQGSMCPLVLLNFVYNV